MNVIVNNRYKIGVIFCGGCNPFFDREKLYKEIIAGFSNTCDILLYNDNQKFDLVLLINGCPSECLMEACYNGCLIVINNINYLSAFELIQNGINEIKFTKMSKGVSPNDF